MTTILGFFIFLSVAVITVVLFYIFRQPSKYLMTMTFSRNKQQQYICIITHCNGKKIWHTSESYHNRNDCIISSLNLFEKIRAGDAKPQYFQDKAGQWRGRFVHSNGKILFSTTEGYDNREELESITNNMIENICNHRYQIQIDPPSFDHRESL